MAEDRDAVLDWLVRSVHFLLKHKAAELQKDRALLANTTAEYPFLSYEAKAEKLGFYNVAIDEAAHLLKGTASPTRDAAAKPAP